MEKFIETVRGYPCLWNPQHRDYHEVKVRTQAWQNVVKENDPSFVPNIIIARSKWRKLRDNHREALKRAKLGQNKLLPAHVTTWKYAKALQFLEPFMKYRITENIEIELTDTKTSDHDVSTTNTLEIKENPCKKPKYNENVSDLAPKIRDEQSDALESFFNCLMKSTRDMPVWMQTQVKKKMFAVIIEAEEQLSAQQNREVGVDYVIEHKIKTEPYED